MNNSMDSKSKQQNFAYAQKANAKEKTSRREARRKLLVPQSKKAVQGSAKLAPALRDARWTLPGQVAVQALFWTLWPSQDVPPFRGVGLVQLRLLFCHPRPQTALQADHVAHVDQPPFTARVPSAKKRGNEQSESGLPDGHEDDKQPKSLSSVLKRRPWCRWQ